jgi:hypothetical protein
MHTPFSTKWLDNFAPNFDSAFEYVLRGGVQSLAGIYRSVFHQQVSDSLCTSKTSRASHANPIFAKMARQTRPKF